MAALLRYLLQPPDKHICHFFYLVVSPCSLLPSDPICCRSFCFSCEDYQPPIPRFPPAHLLLHGLTPCFCPFHSLLDSFTTQRKASAAEPGQKLNGMPSQLALLFRIYGPAVTGRTPA